jgi:hypothetical protein
MAGGLLAGEFMVQRLADASVLTFFAVLYNCAIFMLRFRGQN